MGNIQTEVRPVRRKSPCSRVAKEVKSISMHQPVNPQIKNVFRFMLSVSPDADRICMVMLEKMIKDIYDI